MFRQQQQPLTLALFLVSFAFDVTHGCVCMDTLEARARNADFAALATINSDVISSPEGLYYKIDKSCVLKTPYGTDVGKAYSTTRPRPNGMRTSCDGIELEKDKVYMIIGSLYNEDNGDTDSVLYSDCSGFVVEWDTVYPELKEDLTNILPFDNC